ncbi:MAG: hypothetical protein KAR20_28810, partial [Candidatus Heimdallarchaeota archaeon]|nr:hypothetical protein [Candidatus Heimdallarchaeota archaeon]
MEKEQKDDQRKEYSKSALYFAKLALSASLKTDSESLKIAACSAIVNVRRLIVSTVEDPTTQHQHLLDAIQQVRSFLVLAKAIQQRNAYGYLKIDLGSLQTSLGEITNDPILLKQADDNFAEGITIFESQNETNILGRLYAARGRILSLNGAHSQAASKYQKAFQILKVQRPPRANYYRLWASIEKSKDLHISGKYHQASRELKTGIKAAIGFKEWKTEVKYWEAASRLEYSEFLVDQGRIQLACNWFEKARKAALALIKLLRKETISVYSRKLLIREEFLLLFIDLRIQIIKGRIFSKKGKHRLAVRHFQNSIQSIEKLSLMNTGKLLPDLLTQTEALCNLRYYIKDAYARKDASGLETAKLYLSQNRNVLPPNIEPSIASLSHLLVVFVKCVDLFQTHPIKVRSRQVRDIQDEIGEIAITLEKMKLVPITRHLAMILKLLDALNLVARATRLERFNSKLDLI